MIRSPGRVESSRNESVFGTEMIEFMRELPAMLYRCRNERDWTMEYCSAGCLQLTGYPAEALIGNAAVAYGDLIHPEDREYVWQDIQTAIRAGQPYRLTYRLIRRSGDVIWVWERGKLIASPEGEKLNGVILDISNETRTEIDVRFRVGLKKIALAIATELINLPTEDIDSGIDRALASLGEYVSADRSFLCVLSEDGKNFHFAMPWAVQGRNLPEEQRTVPLERLRWAIDRLNREGLIYIPDREELDPSSQEWRYHQERGVRAALIVPVRREGEVKGLVGFSRLDQPADWSPEVVDLLRFTGEIFANALHRRDEEREARTMALQLAKAHAELQQLAYVTSHDLQEPLRVATSFAELLARRYAGRLDADADEFIGYITSATQRMHALLSGLLDLSRVDTRGAELEAVDCNSILGSALDRIEAAVREHEATVTSDGLPTVLGDELQLTTVFQSLLDNAIKFRNHAPPRVHVSAVRDGSWWTIKVRDNGMGISPEHHERFFGVFQRLHRATEYPGRGIGLPISKKIIERHGGRMWMESAPGEGSTFLFTLPAAD